MALGLTTSSIASGAYVHGAPWSPTALDNFTRMVGVPPKVVTWYESWKDHEFGAGRFDHVVSRGAMPMLTWMPWDPSRGVDQPDYALRTVASGAHDGYVQRWARDAAIWNKPFYMRFAHEMNGDWYPWGAGVNGNVAGDYEKAYRHVHTIFQREGARKVRWVWNPAIQVRNTDYASLYPGDDVVWWVGLDGYNWGTTRWWSSWQSFTQVFEASYNELAELTKKPMMLGEMASIGVGSNAANGGKPNWIRQTYLDDIPSPKFGRIGAVIWFHENKETDWRVDSSPESLAAYKEVVASSTYQGRLP